jgi:hypothetical protein
MECDKVTEEPLLHFIRIARRNIDRRMGRGAHIGDPGFALTRLPQFVPVRPAAMPANPEPASSLVLPLRLANARAE